MIRFLSAACCFLALICHAMQTHHRLGNPVVPAVVVGFGKPTHSLLRSVANYKVRFELNGQEYTAMTIESAAGDSKRSFDYLLGKQVEVYVNEKDPGIVSIRGDHSMDISCGLLLLFGLVGIFLS